MTEMSTTVSANMVRSRLTPLFLLEARPFFDKAKEHNASDQDGAKRPAPCGVLVLLVEAPGVVGVGKLALGDEG